MLKRVIRPMGILLVCLMAISLILAVPSPVEVSAAGEATINLSSQKQEIRGFGGMNHPAWAGDLTAAQRETAFGNGTGQLGFSVLRIFVDSNKNNWSKELATAKKAIEKGAIVFASPWNPPSDMIETFTRNGVANQKRLKYSSYAAYAQYLNEFVTYMKNNGVDLYAISVQNEPDYAHDWTWWTPQEMLNFMKNNAGSINCRVMAPESFQYLKNMSDPILNDAQALANMDILGAHFYGTSIGNMPYPLFQQKGAGKELWMTEVYVPNSSSSADTWPEALDVAYNMHNALVEGNFQAYVWWYIRRSYGPMKEDGNISKRGYMMAHYSKFVRPDYIRVDATKNPNTNVYISAYTGDNKVVIVAINRSTSAVSQNFILQNGATSKVSSWLTDSSRSMAAGSDINVSGGSFTAQLPAQSVTTFVGDLGGSVTPTPTQKSAFSKLEAESYDDQSGIETETCTEGGQNVGYIQNGDYTVYKNVDFGGGASGFQARVATNVQGGNIEVRLDSINGPLVGTCTVGTTGGWQSWADVSCNISGATGKHDLYLKFTGGSDYLFNLNWFRFMQSAFSRIEAESYSSLSSSSIQEADTPDGGKSLAYVENGNYALYGNVDFGSGATSFKAKVATTGATSIEVRLGSSTGTLIGTLPVSSTGGWNVYQEQSCTIDKVTGINDVYLVFKGSVNFDCFSFAEEVNPNPVTLGDLNSDGAINSVDFLLMKKHVLELELLADPACADLDGNGAVNTVDMMLLKQYILELITEFPG